MCIQEVFVPQVLTDCFIFTDEETEARRGVLLESPTERRQQSQDLNSDSVSLENCLFFNLHCLIIKHCGTWQPAFLSGVSAAQKHKEREGKKLFN